MRRAAIAAGWGWLWCLGAAELALLAAEALPLVRPGALPTLQAETRLSPPAQPPIPWSQDS